MEVTRPFLSHSCPIRSIQGESYCLTPTEARIRILTGLAGLLAWLGEHANQHANYMQIWSLLLGSWPPAISAAHSSPYSGTLVPINVLG